MPNSPNANDANNSTGGSFPALSPASASSHQPVAAAANPSETYSLTGPSAKAPSDFDGNSMKASVTGPAISEAGVHSGTLRTVVDVVLTNKSDYRDIFTTRKTFLTKELGAIYQVPVVSFLPNGSPDTWHPYQFTAEDNRAGIMTHMSFTALHSPSGRGSAVLRGKAVREVLLCQKVPAPPGDVSFDLINDTTNYRTARDRLAAHTREPMCAGCHKITDPLGLALENFDAAGAWRTTEGGVQLDTSGLVDGKKFAGPAELGAVIAAMPAATSCVTNRMLGYALGRAPARDQVTGLEKSFQASGYRIPALMKLIATSPSFTRVSPETAPTQTASVAN